MIQNRKRAGFTLIELMIVVAIIAIIASIAIPRLISARLAANESAAIAALRSLSSAQAQVQSSGAIDTDADGGGEFGCFGELSGAQPLRVSVAGAPAAGAAGIDELNPAVLSQAFGNVDANSVISRSGYTFKMYLPANNAPPIAGLQEEAGGGFNAGPFPDSDNCEVMYCCYAWPLDAETTGNRTFFINQEGDLLSTPNRGAGGAPVYTGTAAAGHPAFDAAFTVAGDMSSNMAVGVAGNDANVWVLVQ
jgi:prepilin-type N-terminal cleavage/methylation domain-containing protein